ncbi:MAG: rhamnan synthesis F family protein [Methanobrevibacter sp.]|uniref:rhamnan synthesis F family protein n=1 Tax=Methanobrevibacter sp. TaxID=66852 RepID=UPI002E75ED29|nr:rhamnan synthesis F family protein [Methanobrevibacter sp.]MEE0935638.1 rhamnan synthesis F family protein [Methanobrevibacter sp.]
MKRFGIFLCFDADGIIDDYIYYMLNDICENLEDLVIVSNGFLNEESMSGLSKYTNHNIVIRDNIGFDAGAWRDVMLDIGFNKLSKFDEVILFNDSFFGPIYPFKEMFDKMDGEDVDYWGITNHGEAPNSRDMCPYGYRPRYLQTYFLAFRKNLVESSEFQDYWANLPDYETFEDLAFKHGAVLTKYFEDLGYKWKAFVESRDLEEGRDKAMSFHTYDMYNMVVNRSLPVLKRKAFKLPREIHLRYNMASDISKTMKYLERNTDYDTSLIYKYFLRTMEPSQLVDILNLVKIIPKNQPTTYVTDKKVLLIVHLYYDDIWEYAFNYLKNVPEYIDILITTDSFDKKEFFEEKISNNLKNNVDVIKVEPRGRDMAALLVGARDIVKDYDYFCFMHDKKSQGKEFITVGATFRDVLWENNLASPSYINGIVKEFDENPSLGLIVPPRIYHGTYFYSYVNNYWTLCYDEVINLLRRMNINSKISRDAPPLSIGNCFWAKYDALEPLFNLHWDYSDFPEEPMPGDGTVSHALERVHGYVAASKGYYTKFTMTDEYARSEFFNKSYMFLDTMKQFIAHGTGFFAYIHGFFGFSNSIKTNFKRRIMK